MKTKNSPPGLDLFADQPYMNWRGNARIPFWSNLISFFIAAPIALSSYLLMMLLLLRGSNHIPLGISLALLLLGAVGCGWLVTYLMGSTSKFIGTRFMSREKMFPTYSTWLVWWSSLPSLSTTTPINVKLIKLMESKDREEVLSAIQYTKENGKWHQFSQRALSSHFSSGNFQSVPMWEELTRAGACLMRFDRDFNPLTFMALSHNKVLPALLDQFLARGCGINDRNLDGHSLLDNFVDQQKKYETYTSDFSDTAIDDLDLLLSRGAVVSPQTVKAMEKVMENSNEGSSSVKKEFLSRLKQACLKRLATPSGKAEQFHELPKM